MFNIWVASKARLSRNHHGSSLDYIHCTSSRKLSCTNSPRTLILKPVFRNSDKLHSNTHNFTYLFLASGTYHTYPTSHYQRNPFHPDYLTPPSSPSPSIKPQRKNHAPSSQHRQRMHHRQQSLIFLPYLKPPSFYLSGSPHHNPRPQKLPNKTSPRYEK